MTPRRINFALRSLAGTLIVGACAAIALAYLVPLQDETEGSSVEARTRPTTSPASSPSLEAFAAAWSAPLRQSLSDLPPSPDRPNPAAANAVASSSPGAPVDLVGTIGESLALLRAADGTVTVRAAGEPAAGAEVVAIRPSEVDVRINGALTTLRKPMQGGEPQP